MPSPLRSATATELEPAPAGKVCAAWNVPSPLPRRTETSLLPRFALTRSFTPSPLKSPTATHCGLLPTGSGAAVVKEKAWARAGLARASEKARAMPIITGEHFDVVVLRMTSLSAASGSLRRTDAPAQNVESQEGPAIGWSP